MNSIFFYQTMTTMALVVTIPYVHFERYSDIIQSVVPDGIIWVEVPTTTKNILDKKKNYTGYQPHNMAVFMIVYCGEYEVMRRDHAADGYSRHKKADIEVEKHLQLRDNRRGRLLSKTFPYYLLESILGLIVRCRYLAWWFLPSYELMTYTEN